MNARLAAVLAAPALNATRRSHLRLVRADVEDATFIARLRNDPGLNRHLNAPASDAASQLAWLRGYKAREAAGLEFYFVIVCDGAAKGVVRLYDLRETNGAQSFCWGSWIIEPPSVAGLAVYSLLLAWSIGFERLDFGRTHFEVRRDNDKCVGLYLRLGARIVGERGPEHLLALTRSDYEALRSECAWHIAAHHVAVGRR